MTSGNKYNQQFAFIVFCRVIATILITNTHFNDIYPNENLAVGGLIGDMLFFVISGFCLADLHNESFGHWYYKRIIRILPSVWIFSLIYLCVGDLRINSFYGLFSMFIYPTIYHFVGSIMLLYIPFYFIMKYDKLKQNIPLLLCILTFAWLLCYFLFFDKSLRLDIAQHQITKFPYFFCMLFGAYMRENKEKFVDTPPHLLKWLAVPTSAILYFAGKLVINHFSLDIWQFIIIIFVVCVALAIAIAMAGAESSFASKDRILKPAKVIAPLTLDIYVVQVFIIKRVSSLAFPLNFAVATVLIFVVAWCLNKVSKGIVSLLGKIKK